MHKFRNEHERGPVSRISYFLFHKTTLQALATYPSTWATQKDIIRAKVYVIGHIAILSSEIAHDQIPMILPATVTMMLL